MEIFGDLGERFMDRVHNWSEENEIFNGKTVKEYQKFIDKTKPKEFISTSYSLPWYPPTKSQKQALVKVERFLDLPLYEASINPLRMLIVGAAGVGKSWLIQAIVAKFSSRGRKCLVTGPTGPASHLIEGQTLHSAFAIPYLKDCDWETLAELSDPTDRLRDRLHTLDLLVIDEVSMLGAGFLHYINIQLQKCQLNSNPFGGVSIILAGDIPSQIPPIGDVALYRNPDLHVDFVAVGIGLYRSMTDIIILRENVRTQFCEQQKQLLYNLRRKKVGVDELEILRKRLEKNIDPDVFHAEFKECLRIFPRRAMVNAYNRQKISELGMPVIRVGVKQLPNQPALKNYEPLVIGKGVKVMSTRNMDTSRGMTTGARGVVTGILWEKKKLPGRDMPACVMVDFDSTVRGPRVELNSIPITVVTDFLYCQITNRTYKVESFPLRVAYAATVHAVQGQTLDKACIYMDIPFAENQDYVALSRTRSVEDFVLLDSCLTMDRFGSNRFYRGLHDQAQEFKRMGIYDEVMGKESELSDISESEEVDDENEVKWRDDTKSIIPDTMLDSQLEDFRQEWIQEIDQKPKMLPLADVVTALEETQDQYREEGKFIRSVICDPIDTDNHPVTYDPISPAKWAEVMEYFGHDRNTQALGNNAASEDLVEYPFVRPSDSGEIIEERMEVDSPASPEIPDFLSLGLNDEASTYIAKYLASSEGLNLMEKIENCIRPTFGSSGDQYLCDPRLTSEWYKSNSQVPSGSCSSQENRVTFADICKLSDSLTLTTGCEGTGLTSKDLYPTEQENWEPMEQEFPDNGEFDEIMKDVSKNIDNYNLF